MKKLFLMCLAILLLSVPAFASVGIQDNGTYVGEATTLNFEDSVTATDVDGITNVYIGRLKNYEVFTTGDTLVAADSGKAIIVHDPTIGSAGIAAFVLPAASAGLNFKFVMGSTWYITVDPAGTDAIMYSTNVAGDKIKSAGASADSVELVSDGTRWYVSEMKGTWTDNN
jgi:hypothetical protein